MTSPSQKSKNVFKTQVKNRLILFEGFAPWQFDTTLYKENKKMQKTLDQFAIGEQGIVTSVGGEGKIKRRLFDMGITPGAEVLLRKRAPLGDPLEIEVRDYRLAVRKALAEAVEVKKIER